MCVCEGGFTHLYVCLLLCVLLLAFQARTADWQNGALTAEYFVQRLQETTQLLADYEALVPPPGWTYVWDRWVNVLIGFITSCHMTVMWHSNKNCNMIKCTCAEDGVLIASFSMETEGLMRGKVRTFLESRPFRLTPPEPSVIKTD